jgi:hypothetical protein
MGGLYPPVAGKLWSDPVDASIIPNADIAQDIGSNSRRVKETHSQTVFANDLVLVNSTGNIKPTKIMISGHPAEIPALTPISKYSDGKIYPTDSDSITGKAYIGITLEAIPIGGSGKVLLTGHNIPNCLSGLGFISGDDIFIGETPGSFTNDPSTFSGLDDDLIRVGIADCAESTASGIATDLIMLTDVSARQ